MKMFKICILLIVLLLLTMMIVSLPGKVNAEDPDACLTTPIPGNETITFVSSRNGYYEIYVMDGNECQLLQLTDDLVDAFDPSWSPDGSRLLYSYGGVLVTMNADGSNRTQLLTGAPAGSQNGAVWSPDGTKIAFNIDVGHQEIYVVNSDGTNLQRLTTGESGYVSWSPDSARIVYLDRAGDYDGEIWIMDVDGSNKQMLTTNNSSFEAEPVMSPDGTKIAFNSNRDENREIYVMDADGSNVTRLTFNSNRDLAPDWSPDGSFIAFNSERDGNFEIYVMNADGSNQTRLTNNSAIDFLPEWGGPHLNQPPIVISGGPYNGNEASTIPLDQATASDPDADPLTFAWSIDSSNCSFSDSSVLNPTLSCNDNGIYMATLTVSDGKAEPVSDIASINITNVAPTIDSLIIPLDPVSIIDLGNFEVEVTFSDPAGTYDEPYTCEFDTNNDGTYEVTILADGMACGTPLNYQEPGVYVVKVKVSDKDGGFDTDVADEYIVVFDATSGFVTGGGWIWSEAGWCLLDSICNGAEGKANFGFVSKYKRGASIPTGNTEFNFSAGGLNFHSDAYEWLVVNQGGTNAQFKGSGTINGELATNGTAYKFMIWAKDTGQGNDDTFRIKIWYEDNGSEVLVYDSGFDQPIGGGNIVIHD